ncbi:MAG: transposase [Firmicutes bacterium]|nr:transposase [Bacillota bacterium]
MSKLRRTADEWAEMLKLQRLSGQGVKEWCRANGVNVNSMYNQIAKFHKDEDQSGGKLELKTDKPVKTMAIENVNKVVAIEWKELRPTLEQQREGGKKGSVYIEIGDLRMAADEGYPVKNLAALCKELIQPC